MRIAVLLSLIVAAIVAAVFVVSLWPSRIRTVVVLTSTTVTERAVEGLRLGLSERGWREGDTIRFIIPGVQPSLDALRTQARTLIGRDTDLVVTLSTPAAMAVREMTTPLGVPLLLCPSADPVATGLVSGHVHPGQAVTGVSFATQEPRRLEFLTRLVPHVRRVWVPFDASDPSPATAVARLRDTATKLGVTLVTADIRSYKELRAALDPMPRDIDAVFIPPDGKISSHTRAVVAAAEMRGLPVSTPQREGVEQGALFSYGFDLFALGRQAARLADLILSGTPAADLPIETADMDLSINLAAANHLGLFIPDDILRHAVVFGRPGE